MEKDREKTMAEKTLLPRKEKVNRNAKDAVFVDLFGRMKYLLQLYRVLHPEDTETDESDLTIVTLESLLLKERYNDLGFLVGNRLMILVEAQSKWSVNIIVRLLLYAADTYNRYIEQNGFDLHGSKKVELPVPEFYVIYTGKGKYPETISLGKDIFGSLDGAIEVKVKVIQSSVSGDIIDQYIRYTKVFDEQFRLHGKTRKAVEEVLRICKEQDVLKEYFKEVPDIMYSCLSREYAIQRCLETERLEGRREGLQEGIVEGREKERKRGREATAKALREQGLPEEIISSILQKGFDMVNEEEEPYILSSSENEK